MNEVPEFYQFTLSYDKEIIFYCPNTCIYERKKVEIFKIRHFSTFARVGGFCLSFYYILKFATRGKSGLVGRQNLIIIFADFA